MLAFEWQIGLRYTRAARLGRRNRFISFIAAVSMAGIAIGVAALIVVLSVMNGFRKEVRDRMLSVLPHVEITALSASAMPDWQSLATQLQHSPQAGDEISGAAPFVAAQGLIVRGDTLRGVVVRGVLPQAEPQVSDVGRQVRDGALDDLRPGAFGVLLGRALAYSLGVHVGESVTLMSPQTQTGPTGMLPRVRQLHVVGLVDSGYYEFDSTFVWMHLDDARLLFRDAAQTGLRLRLRDQQRAPEVAHALQAIVPDNLLVSDWSMQNRSWFAAVKVEKTMMSIILGIIVAVAAFNLLATLVMTVTDKQSDIAILRTLGASPRSIMAIFVIQGAIIGAIGALAGVLLGCLIAFNIDVIVPMLEHLLHTRFLPPDIYLISRMPSDPRMSDIVPIGLLSFALALLATLYPSWRAAHVQPAQALRYE